MFTEKPSVALFEQYQAVRPACSIPLVIRSGEHIAEAQKLASRLSENGFIAFVVGDVIESVSRISNQVVLIDWYERDLPASKILEKIHLIIGYACITRLTDEQRFSVGREMIMLAVQTRCRRCHKLVVDEEVAATGISRWMREKFSWSFADQGRLSTCQ